MRKTSQEVVGKLANSNDRVVFIGSDLGPEVLPEFRSKFPERYLMEGISEQHIVGLAAGLAMDGFIPFVHTFSTFLSRRALEQISIDVCHHNLPVKFLAVGGGVAHAALGPTHCATDDLALLRVLPNLTLLAPCDANEASQLIEQTMELSGPAYVRLARGGDAVVSSGKSVIGRNVEMTPPGSIAIVSSGVMTQVALAAADELRAIGLDVGVLHVHTIKPFDVNGLVNFIRKSDLVVTLEEHVLVGGLGSVVVETLSDLDLKLRVFRMGLPDSFVTGYGSQEYLIQKYGLDSISVAKTILELSSKEVFSV